MRISSWNRIRKINSLEIPFYMRQQHRRRKSFVFNVDNFQLLIRIKVNTSANGSIIEVLKLEWKILR